MWFGFSQVLSACLCSPASAWCSSVSPGSSWPPPPPPAAPSGRSARPPAAADACSAPASAASPPAALPARTQFGFNECVRCRGLQKSHNARTCTSCSCDSTDDQSLLALMDFPSASLSSALTLSSSVWRGNRNSVTSRKTPALHRKMSK